MADLLGIVAAGLIGGYVIQTLSVWLRYRVPAVQHYQVLDPSRRPELLAQCEAIDAHVVVLERLGFRRVPDRQGLMTRTRGRAVVVAETLDRSDGRVTANLLAAVGGKLPSERATVHVVLVTRFNNGSWFSVSNAPWPVPFASAKEDRFIQLPHLQGPAHLERLVQLSQSLTDRHANQGGISILPRTIGRDAAAYFSQANTDSMARLVESGALRPLRGSTTEYGVTLPSAARMVWLSVPPGRGMARAMIGRQGRHQDRVAHVLLALAYSIVVGAGPAAAQPVAGGSLAVHDSVVRYIPIPSHGISAWRSS